MLILRSDFSAPSVAELGMLQTFQRAYAESPPTVQREIAYHAMSEGEGASAFRAQQAYAALIGAVVGIVAARVALKGWR